jgi:GntR family transcriptional repressor for pyruvate dehydrogenase complex
MSKGNVSLGGRKHGQPERGEQVVSSSHGEGTMKRVNLQERALREAVADASFRPEMRASHQPPRPRKHGAQAQNLMRQEPGAGRSLVNTAMRAVTDHIRDERLRVGDSLPGEGFFAEQIRVSRAVMREAFGALAALKLIDVGNGRRARVGAIDGSVIAASLDHGIRTSQISGADVWDVRQTIERRTAILAARARTAAEAAEISASAERMSLDCDDLARMTRQDIVFHVAIARASHNNLFVQIVESFGPLMEFVIPAAWHTLETQVQRAAVLERHRAIATAIAKGLPDQAAEAMDAHFDNSIRAVVWDVFKGNRQD